MKKKRVYGTRYSVEKWDKPVPQDEWDTSQRVMPGIRTMEGDYGYTDILLAASILMKEEDGVSTIDSIMLFDTQSMSGQPPKWLLKAVRDQINHYLEHHI